MENFRPMRRNGQQLSEEESVDILKNATSGTLALIGDNGFPYAVPISYAYNNGKLYFHSAPTGHKIDAIKQCNKASFCIIAQDNVLPEKYTTEYRSVIAFGNVYIVDNEEEKLFAARLIGNKYYPNHNETLQNELEKGFARMLIIGFDIVHLTGKEGLELTKKRKNN